MFYQKDLQEIVTALEQQHQIDPIAIELVDPSVAKLYKETTRSKVRLINVTLVESAATVPSGSGCITVTLII